MKLPFFCTYGVFSFLLCSSFAHTTQQECQGVEPILTRSFLESTKEYVTKGPNGELAFGMCQEGDPSQLAVMQKSDDHVHFRICFGNSEKSAAYTAQERFNFVFNAYKVLACCLRYFDQSNNLEPIVEQIVPEENIYLNWPFNCPVTFTQNVRLLYNVYKTTEGQKQCGSLVASWSETTGEASFTYTSFAQMPLIEGEAYGAILGAFAKSDAEES